MGMNQHTGELIAVKEVDMSAIKDQSVIQQLEEEIKLMELIRHPHIVSLLGAEKNSTTFSILMEYVPGKSIDYLLQTFGKFKQVTIQKFIHQLLTALEYLHTHNIIHRDIKGKNVLVDTLGNTKLCDFGSAKQFQDLALSMEVSVSYNYTPLWTAPEVLLGNYSRKIDIWSLGCVIIEMATAKTPWAECNFDNPFRALYHIGNSNQIPELPTHDLDETAIRFLKRLLERDPANRPDASELLQDPFMLAVDNELHNAADERWKDIDEDEEKAAEDSNDIEAVQDSSQLLIGRLNSSAFSFDDENPSSTSLHPNVNISNYSNPVIRASPRNLKGQTQNSPLVTNKSPEEPKNANKELKRPSTSNVPKNNSFQGRFNLHPPQTTAHSSSAPIIPKNPIAQDDNLINPNDLKSSHFRTYTNSSPHNILFPEKAAKPPSETKPGHVASVLKKFSK